jgi:23S rRNA (pseudouridine1915-N3)-methyltransferase
MNASTFIAIIFGVLQYFFNIFYRINRKSASFVRNCNNQTNFQVCKLRKSYKFCRMRITLMMVGKTKVPYVAEGYRDYVRRIRRYLPFSEEVVPDIKSTAGMDQRQVMEKEGEAVLKRIKPADHLILLDERGTVFDSISFAEHLERMEGRTPNIVFLIGGAYGFSETIYQRANEQLSLSRMTYSHQLVRLVFTEQLYRAFTILRGDPYHHK